MIIVPPNTQGLAKASEAVRAGQIVAYPTETVYGLAVDPFSESAIHNLFESKIREMNNPVLLLVDGMEQLKQVVGEVSPRSLKYIETFWPGPLSILFPKSDRLPELITAGSDKVCVRCPACDIARKLCAAVGSAITSTSANISGEKPARSLEEINFEGVAVGIDGGRLESSDPSTVLDPESGTVLREGVIKVSELNTIVSGTKHLLKT